MNLFEKYFYIFLVLYFPQSELSHGLSHYLVKILKKQVGRICLYIALISFILWAGLGIITFFTMTTITTIE